VKAIRAPGDEPCLVVEALGRSVAQARADVGEDAGRELLDGARELHEGLESAPRGPVAPAAQLSGCNTGLPTPEDVGEPFLQQVGAEDALVGALQVGELRSFCRVEVPRALQQRPARALDGPGVAGGLRGAHLVPADSVDRVRGEALDVEPVEDELGLGRVLRHGRAVGRRQVHGDVGELLRALGAERREELPERLGRLAFADPHDALAHVVDDDRDVVVVPPERELVDADDGEIVQARRVELLADDALDDGADGAPVDAGQLADRRLAHLLREVGHQLFHAPREARLRRRPRHRLHVHAAVLASDAPRGVAQQRHRLAERQVAPEPRLPRLVDGARLAALGAARSPPARLHVDDQLFPLEHDVFHARRDDAQQASEYGGDAHGGPSIGDESRNPEPTENRPCAFSLSADVQADNAAFFTHTKSKRAIL